MKDETEKFYAINLRLKTRLSRNPMLRLIKDAVLRMPEPLREPLQRVWRRAPPADRRFLLQDLDDPQKREALLYSADYAGFAAQEMRHWSDYHLTEPSGEAVPAVFESRPNHYSEHPLDRKSVV